jgi:hypothetical protein
LGSAEGESGDLSRQQANALQSETGSLSLEQANALQQGIMGLRSVLAALGRAPSDPGAAGLLSSCNGMLALLTTAATRRGVDTSGDIGSKPRSADALQHGVLGMQAVLSALSPTTGSSVTTPELLHACTSVLSLLSLSSTRAAALSATDAVGQLSDAAGQPTLLRRSVRKARSPAVVGGTESTVQV